MPKELLNIEPSLFKDILLDADAIASKSVTSLSSETIIIINLTQLKISTFKLKNH
jgi:hypothetical protein